MPAALVPEPLGKILATLFHANAYDSGWPAELLRWEKQDPAYPDLIRRQFADVIFRNSLSVAQFKALTGGHDVTDEASLHEWFRQRFRDYWGRTPYEWDATPE
jgi:hypothetical protein